jgi:hypothetical protein
MAGEERDSDKRTMGVDDHHGAQVEMSAAEKLSLQDLYPLSLVNPSEQDCFPTTSWCVALEVLAHQLPR